MDQAKQRLHAAGLRVTRPRLAVLAEVAAHPHGDVEAIGAGARAQLGSLSTQAVYDVVHALTEAGLLRRVEPAGSVARFELDTGDNHHHLVCRVCGQIVDVECAVGRAPCLQASDDAGYLVDEAEVTYWGVCHDCQAAREPTTSGRTSQHEPNQRKWRAHEHRRQHPRHRSYRSPRTTEAGAFDSSGR